MSQSSIKINYEKYLKQQLHSILNKSIGPRQKAKMIQGFLCLLRQKQQIERQKYRQNLSTELSEAQSNFTAYQHEIDDLEERILQKRVIKFQINEEIQGTQEDLFQIEKTIETKRQYDENLRKQIDIRMQMIEKNQLPPQKNKQNDIGQSPSYINKSIGAVSGLFKGWLY